ncbi:MAG: protein kinase [Chloroflexi bacterium]|nr:protein kinase [Chloroflexota bacterium]
MNSMNSFGLESRFQVLELLGGGGFADVYKAVRKSDRLTVALKLPRLAGFQTAQHDLFLKEAEKWKNLRHAHIVPLIEFGRTPVPYIAMEYMSAGSLRGRIGKLAIPEALAVAAQVAEGLFYAHRCGLVHLDIKPENILFDAEGKARLSDWGLSRVMLASSAGSTASAGTLAYSAPEQVFPPRFGERDWQTDVWQFGATLYEMVTGRLPFQADNILELGQKICTEEPLPPRQFRPHLDIPGELNDLIMRCLRKDKKERFRDFYPIQGAIETLLRPPAKVETFSTPTTQRRSREGGNPVVPQKRQPSPVPATSKTRTGTLHVPPQQEGEPSPIPAAVPGPEPQRKRRPVLAIVLPLLFVVLLGAGGLTYWAAANKKPPPMIPPTATPAAAGVAQRATPPAPAPTSTPAPKPATAAPTPLPGTEPRKPAAVNEPPVPRLPDAVTTRPSFFKGGELAGGHSDSIPVQLKVGEMLQGEIIAVRNQSLSWDIADFSGRVVQSFGTTDTRAGFYYAPEVDGQHYIVITNPRDWEIGTHGYQVTYSTTGSTVPPGAGSGQGSGAPVIKWVLIIASAGVVFFIIRRLSWGAKRG